MSPACSSRMPTRSGWRPGCGGIGDGGVLRGEGPDQLLDSPLLGQGPGQVAGLLQQAADPVVADGQLTAVVGDVGVFGGQRPSAPGLPLLGQGPGQVAGLLHQAAELVVVWRGRGGRRARPSVAGEGLAHPRGPAEGRQRPASSRSPRGHRRHCGGRSPGPGGPRPSPLAPSPAARPAHRASWCAARAPAWSPSLEGFLAQAVQCPRQLDLLRRAGAGRRRQLAADRHRLAVRLQRLGLLADPVDQLAQLRVRLGQHRLRAGIGLAPQQLAQPVVEPPRRTQQLVPQRPQPVLLQRSSSSTPPLNDRIASRASSNRACTWAWPASAWASSEFGVGAVQLGVLGVEPPVGRVLHGDRRGRADDDRQHDRRRQRRDRRPPPAPQPGPLGRPDPPRRDRAALQPGVQVVGQGLGRRVAPPRVLLQALQADRLQVAGHAALSLRGGSGGRFRTASIVSTTVSPPNGARPVSRA